MNKVEIISLLKLLEDPDDSVYQIIKSKILDCSDLFKIYLENYHSLSINKLALERSEKLLDEIFFNNFSKELKLYLKNPNSTLLKGAILLEHYFNRDLDLKQLEINIEQILKNIWIELNDGLTGIEKIKLINRIIFKEQKFKKYPIGEFKEEYINFSNCVNYKKYISPTISLLYCIIAERSDIALYPLDIQGVFLLGYMDNDFNTDLLNEDKGNISLYIHPYDEGEFVNPFTISKYLKMYKSTKTLNEVQVRSYTDFLFYLFELRILILQQKKIDCFELNYAQEVLKIYNNNKYDL